MLANDPGEQPNGTLLPPVGIGEIPASGRYQARCLDPDTSRIVSVLQTFATKRGADRWLAAKRIEPRFGPCRFAGSAPHVDDWVADMIERG